MERCGTMNDNSREVDKAQMVARSGQRRSVEGSEQSALDSKGKETGTGGTM